MKHLTASIVTLMLAASVAVDTCAQTIRIATYNVNYANRQDKELLAAIAESKADIVCLQETTSRSGDLIRKHFADVYPEFHHEAEFAIASKIEPREAKFHRVENFFGGGFYVASFKSGDWEFQVANVHLSAITLPGNPGVLDVLQAVSATEHEHSVEVAAILKSSDASIPMIVVGDFNSVSTSNAPVRLRENGFVDSFASVHKDADQHLTWDWRAMLQVESEDYKRDSAGVVNLARPLSFGLRIDYIFHSKHFRTVNSEVIQRPGSDHFLVVSELMLGRTGLK